MATAAQIAQASAPILKPQVAALFAKHAQETSPLTGTVERLERLSGGVQDSGGAQDSLEPVADVSRRPPVAPTHNGAPQPEASPSQPLLPPTQVLANRAADFARVRHRIRESSHFEMPQRVNIATSDAPVVRDSGCVRDGNALSSGPKATSGPRGHTLEPNLKVWALSQGKRGARPTEHDCSALWARPGVPSLAEAAACMRFYRVYFPGRNKHSVS